ncbi:MAG TPA: MarR family transcriptional regulator [Thermoanaerobaculaceae bacterium]|nr:MarR family transcriptional regulator [Thermoanaerobaculaceae bacterium]
MGTPERRGVSAAEFAQLAEFRYQIRRFVRFSESVARAAGLEPRQHQLLLALKGFGRGKRPSVGELAERLQILHHSAVGLVDRLERRGLVVRSREDEDRRLVSVALTARGETLIDELSRHHLAELRQAGPALVEVLASLSSGTGRRAARRRRKAAT